MQLSFFLFFFVFRSSSESTGVLIFCVLDFAIIVVFPITLDDVFRVSVAEELGVTLG